MTYSVSERPINRRYKAFNNASRVHVAAAATGSLPEFHIEARTKEKLVRGK
jgi:hypothetical protein